MYEAFFNMSEEPFGVTPDPKFLYLSRKHREALDNLSYGIDRRKGFILITGEIGTGKTTICRSLLKKIKNTNSALIINPTFSESELLSAIIKDFGVEPGDAATGNLSRINNFLLDASKARKNNVVILDEAQNFSNEALEMVRLLSNLETDNEKLLQLVLVGQPELREKLENSELRQLKQRLVVRYHLEPLDHSEVKDYIFHRLRVAGSSGEYLKFTPTALEMIFSYTKGLPRLINILCDRVLMAAYVNEKRLIGPELVSKAICDVEGRKAPIMSDRKRKGGFLRYLNIFKRK